MKAWLIVGTLIAALCACAILALMYLPGLLPGDRGPGTNVFSYAWRNLIIIHAMESDFFQDTTQGRIPSRPKAGYASLKELRSVPNLGLTYSSDYVGEVNGYRYESMLPKNDPNPHFWCVVASPSNPETRGKWPSFVIDQSGKRYQSRRSFRNAPQLEDVYSGAPFVSSVRSDLWQVQDTAPK
jgi:hypothetical protein